MNPTPRSGPALVGQPSSGNSSTGGKISAIVLRLLKLIDRVLRAVLSKIEGLHSLRHIEAPIREAVWSITALCSRMEDRIELQKFNQKTQSHE